MKFCKHVRLLSVQVFSHFGELCLVGSHGGGITSGMSYIEIAVGSQNWAPWLGGQSELWAVLSREVVLWDLRLASLLTHLFSC